MVGGPIKEISVSAEEQAVLDRDQVHTNSIYDVAVNPAVIQAAQDDPTAHQKELVSFTPSCFFILTNCVCLFDSCVSRC